MHIYPELKKIAGKNAAIKRLTEQLEEKIDCADLHLQEAYLVDGCSEKDGHLYHKGGRLDSDGLVDNEYYCKQSNGFLEDEYSGTMYYKTDVPGQFVAVPFSTY